MVGLTSAAGVVGFLSEPDPALRSFALQRLNEEIDLLWPEVAGSVSQIEALYEDESFPERELAALVAAKVYYQLQEYNESMVFALGAGKLFDIHKAAEFEETILAKCLDTYIALSVMHNPPTPVSKASQAPPQLSTSFSGNAAGGSSTSASLASPITPFSQSALPSKSLLSREDSSTFDPTVPGGGNAGVAGAHPTPMVLQRNVQKNLHSTVRRIFESCYVSGNYKQVVGIAIEARNLEVLREAIVRASQDGKKQGKKPAQPSAQSEDLMEYVLDICMNVVQERGLRNEILRLILDLLNDDQIPNPDYFSIAKCVVYLNQHSLASKLVRQLIERGDDRSRAVAYQISFDLYENGTQEFLAKVMEELPEAEKEETSGDASQKADAGESDSLLGNTDTSNVSSAKGASEDQLKAFGSVRHILRGTKSIELNLEFLYRNNRTDKAVLNRIRDSLEARNSIFHSSVTFANAFMNAGTTNDTFFRENLDWLGKAVNWSKFSATAALGVIHRGNITQGQKLLEPYLPKDSVSSGSHYEQGGSLYALGLIYANHGSNVLDLLLKQFQNASEEVIQHGGALGLGVAGMATGSEEIFDAFKNVLYTDSAINGEAVGLSMGLVMLGTGNIKALEDMIQYAHDTQHEKIVRGLAMGMALIMYARQEAADELINGLLDDPDPTLRYGGIMTIALAYCGTGSNKAVRRLLHVAVSDVSDDVRRVAVMSLGFILFRKPGSVPRMVELLAESYNPHVRYGATMALGIACAGTGLPEAVDLLEPMMKDSTDFVRQGALIALSMIMVQQNEAMNPKVASIRKQLAKVVGDRHEDAMAKFGCALALGIIDAGGRNCTIGLQTPTGNLNMAAIVGMAVFTQYWYWFPLTHFLSLSFTPTAVIGLDQELEIPSFKFHSNTRPSMFDYPPDAEVKAEEAPEKIKTAVLSTTAQDKRRRMVKERQKRRESMDVDHTPNTPKPSADDDKMDIDEDAKKEDADRAQTVESSKKKVEKEKVGYELENMSRVLPPQVKYISFPSERYVPVKKPTLGVILLTDTKPSEPKTLLELKVKKAAPAPAPGASGSSADQGHEGISVTTAAAPVSDNMVDEGHAEASTPGEFVYESDTNPDDDD
ncbi:RPN2 26S proteasome regulatory complex component [Pyrenophora tritici-repentis]|uniref:26S proteasome regulatory subunit RPN2 n=2 Tax=Pyrenophora tritici-repentis TaxID=45151 RepID=A0A2W1E444_9PLEO|nr:26S proteasome regulatory subunit rpn2 [Pyrenophora tritici-repentis Pt-1C-BFP]KAA8615024.1 26S proteasome regulatory subunit rpn2 [Pyrenophora tritici-repentis]EDU50350.1 26S proteasome regulatory subunit rpn2 [Pyrenophora tritici-repentis Pt-1C-BFP]KAF7444846.1 26S proteasome regulatory protein [Pyrenophora tritici-repentis]KAF7564489.1 RPN2, 26S proteasome regulatory complex component [Pyrenophora tritici-repentis]KAG9379084.1 26S proteasome regulatory protein [Pyrenophora tritici-repent